MSEDPNDSGLDSVLLARFLAGDATPAERAEVLRWCAEDPDREVELASMRRIWEQTGGMPSPERMASMWTSLSRRISEAEAGPRLEIARLPTPPSAARPRWRARFRSVALHLAPTVAMAGLAVFLLRDHRDPASTDQAPEIEMVREIRTERAEQANLRLADGTKVNLGPESSLRIRYVTDGPREVVLEGQAIFDVVHDEKRPFRVRSAHALAQDLGTRFGVRAYPGDEVVQVVVEEGVVSLRPQSAPENSADILVPGQLARLDLDGRIEKESGVNAAAYLGWAEDRLFFRQVPLREIARHLERRHDVTIEIADSALAATLITLDVKAATLSVVLETIAASMRLKIDRSEPKVVLRRLAPPFRR